MNRPDSLPVLLATALLLLALPLSANAQETITGTVTDAESGETLPGVNVTVPGTTIGTATTSQGTYSLDGVPADADSLIFSFVGYQRLVEPIEGRSVINIALQPTVQQMGEAVVIGYGSKNQDLLTESIGSVESGEIEELAIASPEQALQGRVSGVQITNTDGTPGGAISVRIRGVGTVGNTQPLFVIDGVPVGRGSGGRDTQSPLASINPADIESISVLKDASAAAAYGVRAANGVVLIETKGGQEGDPRISFNSSYGIQRMPEMWDKASTQQWITLTQEANQNFNEQFGYDPSNPDYEELHPDLRQGNTVRGVNLREIDTPWLDNAVNENAPVMEYNLSVSGGSERLNYYVSAGYFNQEATADRWNLERYSVRVNTDYEITDWLSFGENLSISHRNTVRGMNGGGDGFLLRNALSMPPFFEIYDTRNEIVDNRYGFHGNRGPTGNDPRGGITTANQNGINQIVDNHDRTGRLLGGLNLEADIIGGLSFKTEAHLDFNYDRNNSWQPPYSGAEVGLDRTQEQYTDSRSESYTQVFTNSLNYEGDIGDHSIDALAALELQRLRSTTNAARGGGFVSFAESYRTTGNLSEDITVTGGAGASDFVGYIGRVSYDYQEKYLLTTTVRRDGSSAFSPDDNRRWGIFPSVSAAWRIGEEDFFQPLNPIVSSLKIRGSWGQLGNDATVSYPHIFQVSTVTDYGLGNTTVTGAVPSNFVNKDVTWETVETIDFGFTASFLEQRVDLGATYYRRNTKDFLLFVPVPNISGFGSAPVNAGEVLNSGIELEAGYVDQFGDVNLNVSANLTTVNNELVSLRPGIQEFSSGGGYRTTVGDPISYFWAYKSDGLYQSEEEASNALPDNNRSSNATAQPGDVRFVDVGRPCTTQDYEDNVCAEGQAYLDEGDGQITAADRTYVGKTIPDFYYGLNLNASWRQFDVGMLLQGVAGVQRYNQVRQFALGLGGGPDLAAGMDRWTEENPDEDLPRAVANDPNDNNRISDFWIEDAGYLRLKNLQVGYTVPPSLARGVFDRARVYVSGSNLLTFTPYSGLDPEVRTYRSSDNQIQAGTDQGNMPNPKTYRIGVQLQF